ncbi:MAG TPA: hypothetical protein VKE70_16055 [Candidatus Solibacter sp.]|nr:hypothetical protein [Candidatus Solibacter sp.]
MSDLSNRLATGPAADLLRKTLSQIPTQFGRLVFVASLRDAAGSYIYRPMIESMGREITDRTIANSHYTVFAEWIATPLSTQKSDLDEYLREHSAMTDAAAFRELAPAAAHDIERQLYLTDLETLLTMRRFEAGGASSNPKA